MSAEEYIKQCGVSSAKELTDDQILHFFLCRHGGISNWTSASWIMQGRVLGLDVDRVKGMALLRQAFEENKELTILFIEGEGVVEAGYIGPPHFEMELR